MRPVDPRSACHTHTADGSAADIAEEAESRWRSFTAGVATPAASTAATTALAAYPTSAEQPSGIVGIATIAGRAPGSPGKKITKIGTVAPAQNRGGAAVHAVVSAPTRKRAAGADQVWPRLAERTPWGRAGTQADVFKVDQEIRIWWPLEDQPAKKTTPKETRKVFGLYPAKVITASMPGGTVEVEFMVDGPRVERWQWQAPDRFTLLMGEEVATEHVDTYSPSDIAAYVRVRAEIPAPAQPRQRAKGAAAVGAQPSHPHPPAVRPPLQSDDVGDDVATAAAADSQHRPGGLFDRTKLAAAKCTKPASTPRRTSRGKLRGAGDALLLAEIKDHMQAVMLLDDLEIRVCDTRERLTEAASVMVDRIGLGGGMSVSQKVLFLVNRFCDHSTFITVALTTKSTKLNQAYLTFGWALAPPVTGARCVEIMYLACPTDAAARSGATLTAALMVACRQINQLDEWGYLAVCAANTKRREWWRELGFVPLSPQMEPPKLATATTPLRPGASIMLLKIRDVASTGVAELMAITKQAETAGMVKLVEAQQMTQRMPQQIRQCASPPLPGNRGDSRGVSGSHGKRWHSDAPRPRSESPQKRFRHAGPGSSTAEMPPPPPPVPPPPPHTASLPGRAARSAIALGACVSAVPAWSASAAPAVTDAELCKMVKTEILWGILHAAKNMEGWPHPAPSVCVGVVVHHRDGTKAAKAWGLSAQPGVAVGSAGVAGPGTGSAPPVVSALGQLAALLTAEHAPDAMAGQSRKPSEQSRKPSEQRELVVIANSRFMSLEACRAVQSFCAEHSLSVVAACFPMPPSPSASNFSWDLELNNGRAFGADAPANTPDLVYSVLRKAIQKSKFCSQLGALLDALDLKHCQVQTAGAPIGAGPAIASAAKQATVTDFCNGTDFTFCGGHIQL